MKASNSFLHRELDEEIYMSLTHGYMHENNEVIPLMMYAFYTRAFIA